MIIDMNRYNGGGGSGSGVTPEQVQEQIESALTPYWESGETKDYVDEAVSGISLDGYWTSAETQSAITAVEDHLYDVEQVTASALTELHEGLVEVSGRSVDLSGYYTSAQTEDAISAATSGKADAANVSANTSDYVFPAWNEDGVVTGEVKKAYKNNIKLNNYPLDVYGLNRDNLAFFAPTAGGTAGQVLVSTGNGAPVWSAVTFPTPDVDKAYVDSAITGVQDQLDVIDEVIPAAINDLNQKISEISGGSGGDMSAYWTSAQTEEAISAATSGKADAANTTPTDGGYFPIWNAQGIITGRGPAAKTNDITINGVSKSYWGRGNGNPAPFYAPLSAGTAGQILVSAGNGAPIWANDNKVSSTSVSTIWKGTQAEYDAITTKDASTLYIIL